MTDKELENEKDQEDEDILDEDKDIESENESLKIELEKAKSDLDSFNDKYLRLAAEYKNYKERSEKEKSNIRQDSLVDAVSSILPIIDDIERTLPSFSNAGEKYEKGVSMILKRTSDCLKNLGVEEFGKKGDEFDPNIHSASSKIESDEDISVISEVYQKGYKIQNKLIRPAMVQVRG